LDRSAQQFFYEGALNDPGGTETKIMGFNENSFTLAIVTLILASGVKLFIRSSVE
jgi:hypothetical protein